MHYRFYSFRVSGRFAGLVRRTDSEIEYAGVAGWFAQPELLLRHFIDPGSSTLEQITDEQASLLAPWYGLLTEGEGEL